MKGKNIGKIPICLGGIKLKDLPCQQQLASRSKHRKKPVYFYDDYIQGK